MISHLGPNLWSRAPGRARLPPVKSSLDDIYSKRPEEKLRVIGDFTTEEYMILLVSVFVLVS